MKKLLVLVIPLLFIGSCIPEGCKTGTIDEFEMGFSKEPNCAYLGLRITIKDASFKTAIESTPDIAINIHGAFFDDTLFYMGEPEIRFYKEDSYVITTRSCFFNNKSADELNVLANNALKEISIIISKKDKKWIFKQAKYILADLSLLHPVANDNQNSGTSPGFCFKRPTVEP